MAIVGALMLVTGGLQLRRRQEGTRGRDDVSTIDAALAGVAQGFAVLPGLSRSGLTVAALVGRKVDRREALVLSFLMSAPASLAASLYVGFDSDFVISTEVVVAAVVAFVAGLVAIRALVTVARRVNFGAFVLILGVAILGGALWEAFQ